MRKDDPEFYEDGIYHAEAVIHLLKKTARALRTEEVFEMVKPMKLKRKVANAHSLYATLTKLKHRGLVDYDPYAKKWRTSDHYKKLRLN